MNLKELADEYVSEMVMPKYKHALMDSTERTDAINNERTSFIQAIEWVSGRVAAIFSPINDNQDVALNMKTTQRNVTRGCRMTLSEFRQSAIDGYIDEEDGFGYYGTFEKQSNEIVDFYDILEDTFPKWATHIYWYNK